MYAPPSHHGPSAPERLPAARARPQHPSQAQNGIREQPKDRERENERLYARHGIFNRQEPAKNRNRHEQCHQGSPPKTSILPPLICVWHSSAV